MDYEQIKETLINYIEECHHKINNLTFTNQQLNDSISIKNSLIRKGKIKEDSTIEEAIKYHRQEYLDVKLRHTLRVVDSVMRISRHMHLNEEFTELLKCSAILHDIGRFDQAIWTNNFMDTVYTSRNKNNPYRQKRITNFNGNNAIITNHDRAGYYLLFEEEMIKNYNLDPKYYPVIGDTVYYHGDAFIPKHLDMDLTDYFKKGMSLTLPLNIISAAILQIVRDADKIDILYQYTTPEISVIRETFSYPIMKENIEDISNKFGISKNEILEWNGLKEEDFINKKRINIPLKNVKPDVLKIDPVLRKRFLHNDIISLKELGKRQDQHFVTVIWWRLSAFLNDINFIATLIELQESHLLDKIYNRYPDEYKQLVIEIFNYAKIELIDKTIRNHKPDVYCKDKFMVSL